MEHKKEETNLMMYLLILMMLVVVATVGYIYVQYTQDLNSYEWQIKNDTPNNTLPATNDTDNINDGNHGSESTSSLIIEEEVIPEEEVIETEPLIDDSPDSTEQ